MAPLRNQRLARRRERERQRDRKRLRREQAHARLAHAARGVLVAVALLFSFLPVPFAASPISYIPFITVVLFLAVDRICLSALVRSLTFDEESMQPTCERGELIDFTISLLNSSILVFPRVEVVFYISDLFGGYAHSLKTSTALMPHERAELSFEARFAHLGRYSAGVKGVVVHDLLGLWSRVIENPHRRPVRVLPKLFDPGKVELSNVSLKESQKVYRPIATDEMDYAGVRDYHYGDPLKTVHWKLSSRYPGAELYTRLFEVYGNPGMEIVVDNCTPMYDTDDLMHVYDGLVEGTFSLNEYARNGGIEAKVAYLDKSGQASSAQVASAVNIEDVIDSMAVATPVEESSDPEAAINLLRREGSANHGMNNMVFVTSRLDEEVVSALVDMKMRRRNPLLVLVLPRSVEGKERDEFLAPLRRLDIAQVGFFILESTDEATKAVAG